MKSNNSFKNIFNVCVVLLSLFNTISSDAQSADTNAAKAAYYAYNSLADAERESAYEVPQTVAAYGDSHPNIEKTGNAIHEALGPESAEMLSLAALILGVINTIALVATSVRQASLDTDQNSICSTAKALGNLNIATVTATPTTANWNAMVALINGIATPSC